MNPFYGLSFRCIVALLIATSVFACVPKGEDSSENSLPEPTDSSSITGPMGHINQGDLDGDLNDQDLIGPRLDDSETEDQSAQADSDTTVLIPTPSLSTDPGPEPLATPSPSPSVGPGSSGFIVDAQFPKFALFTNESISIRVQDRSVHIRFLCHADPYTYIPKPDPPKASEFNSQQPLPSSLSVSSILQNDGSFAVNSLPNRISECLKFEIEAGMWRMRSLHVQTANDQISKRKIVIDWPKKSFALVLHEHSALFPVPSFRLKKADSTHRTTTRELSFQNGKIIQTVTCQYTGGPLNGRSFIFSSQPVNFIISSNILLIEQPELTQIDETFKVANPVVPGNITVVCTAPQLNSINYYELTYSRSLELYTLSLKNYLWYDAPYFRGKSVGH